MTTQEAARLGGGRRLRGAATTGGAVPVDGEGASALTPSPSQMCPPHHWMLSTPSGETCEGVCIKCDARRTYSNSDDGVQSLSKQAVAHRERLARAGESSRKANQKGGAATDGQRSKFYQELSS